MQGATKVYTAESESLKGKQQSGGEILAVGPGSTTSVGDIATAAKDKSAATTTDGDKTTAAAKNERAATTTDGDAEAKKEQEETEEQQCNA